MAFLVLKKKNSLLLAVFSLLYPSSILAAELEWSFIQGNSGGMYFSTYDELFSSKYIPGEYLIDVEFNGQAIGKRLLIITEHDKEKLCLSELWLAEANIPINTQFFSLEHDKERQCYVIEDNEYTEVNFDFSTQFLSIILPQKGILKEVSKNEWDYGIPAIRMSYNANLNTNETKTSLYGSSSIKANYGGWVGNGAVSVTEDGANIQALNTSRGLYELKSDLTVGKSHTGGSIIGGASMVGISLSTNRNMQITPPGYTRIFSGIANSNARVSLVQSGRIIYSELVPPGPFEINNVSLYSSGDVTMKITENDGSVSEQLYSISISPDMLSPNELDYKVYAGLRDSGEEELNGVFVGSNFGYGLDSLTLRGEGLVHMKYASLGSGISKGFGDIGIVGLKAAYSYAQYNEDLTQKGVKYSATYSNSIMKNTDINIRSTQYGNGNFISFSSFNSQSSDEISKNELDAQYDINLTHQLSSQWRASLSASQRVYRGDNEDRKSVNGYLSAKFDWFSTSVGLSMSKRGDETDYRSSLSVSFPFNTFGRKVSASTTVNRAHNGDINYNTSVSSSLSEELSASASVAGNNTGSDESYTLRARYTGEHSTFSGNATQNVGKVTGGAGVSGSLIVLPKEKDIILARNISDTVIVASVDQIKGVKFRSSPYLSNSKGNTLIAATGYRENRINLEGALPADIELLETHKRIYPAAGSVVYLPFKSVKVKRYLFQITDNQDDFISPGKWAVSDTGKPLGFITQHGVLYITSIDELKSFSVGECMVNHIMDTRELQQVKCE